MNTKKIILDNIYIQTTISQHLHSQKIEKNTS